MSSELLHIQNLFKKLCKQPIYEFPKPREALHASDKQGVYVIMNSKNRVVHVGRTPRAKHGICQRLKNHLSICGWPARNQIGKSVLTNA